MTGEEWLVLAGLIDEWWPGRFEKATDEAWFLALRDFEAQAVADALKVRLWSGETHRPSLGDVIGELRRDPSAPTFDEMYRLVYGPGGVLWNLPTAPDRFRAVLAERVAAVHPLVGAFVQRFGAERLRMLPLDDPEYGMARRRELEASWDDYVERVDSRQAAAWIGRGGEGGLRSLDPLAAIGAARRQIESGGDE